MLRLPQFEIEAPASLSEAIALLKKHGPDALVIAGGTDLVPNLKHELFAPKVLVSLGDIGELRGIEPTPDNGLRIGATTPLADIAADVRVRERTPALSQAASLVAGPQQRRMGTIGGNVMLDTRCQWYNQTHFWRQALGYCLKKDGTVCHVIESGKKCVAAASNDTAPALMTLGAILEIEGPKGHREVPVDDFWLSDGIYNKKLEGNEILAGIRIPPTIDGHRGAYGKLRDRGSIDFPLLGIAVRLDTDPDGAVSAVDMVIIALQARPVRVKGLAGVLAGTVPGTDQFNEAVRACAGIAEKRCRPMPNIPGDADYRHAMVPVYARRTLLAAAEGNGPVHHI